MAPKEEAYFKMLGAEDAQAAKMKDDSSRSVWFLTTFKHSFYL